MNLIAASLIVGLIYIALHWFIMPLSKPKKRRGRVVKMYDEEDVTESFYHK